MTILTLHIQKPVEHAKTLLSESTALRTLFGAADATEASELIHYGYAEDKSGDTTEQAEKPLPRAIVALKDFSSEKSGTWSTLIAITCRIEAETPAEDESKSLGDRYFAWLGRLEGVIDDVRQLASDGTRLQIRRVELSIFPHLRDPETYEGDKERWITQFTLGVET